MRIIKIKIDRNSNGTVNMDSEQNQKYILEYLLPIINYNEGWGTKDLSFDSYSKVPLPKKQFLIDSSFGETKYAVNWIYLDDQNEPQGLFMAKLYTPTDISNPQGKVAKTLNQMIANAKSEWWKLLIDQKLVTQKLIDKHLSEVFRIISTTNYYFETGIVIRPELQGKSSGVADALMSLVDGVQLGWTNSPYFVAKCRKIYFKTLYFPVDAGAIVTSYDLASLVYVCSSLAAWSNSSWKSMKFGVAKSNYFVNHRDSGVLDVAEQMVKAGRLLEHDKINIQELIQTDFTQSAVVTFSN